MTRISKRRIPLEHNKSEATTRGISSIDTEMSCKSDTGKKQCRINRFHPRFPTVKGNTGSEDAVRERDLVRKRIKFPI